MSYALGVEAGCEALERRLSLAPVLTAAYRIATTPEGGGMIRGLLEVLASALDKLQAAGLTFETTSDTARAIFAAPPATRRVLIAGTCMNLGQDAGDLLGELSATVYASSDLLTAGERKVVEQRPQISRVEIVAMPERQTNLSVSRDAAGRIVDIEKDEFDRIAC